jgi:hypothetical protein
MRLPRTISNVAAFAAALLSITATARADVNGGTFLGGVFSGSVWRVTCTGVGLAQCTTGQVTASQTAPNAAPVTNAFQTVLNEGNFASVATVIDFGAGTNIAPGKNFAPAVNLQDFLKSGPFTPHPGAGAINIPGLMNGTADMSVCSAGQVATGVGGCGTTPYTTVLQLTGTVNLITGVTYHIVHDDGVTLFLDGSSTDFFSGAAASPTSATVSNFTASTGAHTFNLFYAGCCANPEELTIWFDQPSGQVPEPTSIVLLGTAIVGVLGGIRRKLSRTA